MKVTEAAFVQGFIRMCDDGFKQNWHERNGGNLSYRIKPEEVDEVKEELCFDKPWQPIGTSVPGLAGEYFLVTGSGKYFRNVILDPAANICIIRVDDKGEEFQICWGLVNGGRPTSELPSHLMNHEVKKQLTDGRHRVIYHAHAQLPGSFHLLAESTGYPAFLEEYGFGMKLFHQDLLVFSGCVVVEVLLGEALFPGELARAVTVEDAEVTAGILPQRLQLTYGLYAGQCK